MRAITAAQIFMFTLVFYCVLVMNDSTERFERGTQVFQQWAAVPTARASIVLDEMTLEAKESLGALQGALKPLKLDRHLTAVEKRINGRVRLFKSYVTKQLDINTNGTSQPRVDR